MYDPLIDWTPGLTGTVVSSHIYFVYDPLIDWTPGLTGSIISSHIYSLCMIR